MLPSTKNRKQEEALMKEYALSLISEMDFSKDDVDDEVDFFYECQCESDKNQGIYKIFYSLVDMMKHQFGIDVFDASDTIRDSINDLISSTIKLQNSFQ